MLRCGFADFCTLSVKVDIYFTAIGLIDLPTEDEITGLMAKSKANLQEYRLTA